MRRKGVDMRWKGVDMRWKGVDLIRTGKVMTSKDRRRKSNELLCEGEVRHREVTPCTGNAKFGNAWEKQRTAEEEQRTAVLWLCDS